MNVKQKIYEDRRGLDDVTLINQLTVSTKEAKKKDGCHLDKATKDETKEITQRITE